MTRAKAQIEKAVNQRRAAQIIQAGLSPPRAAGYKGRFTDPVQLAEKARTKIEQSRHFQLVVNDDGTQLRLELTDNYLVVGPLAFTDNSLREMASARCCTTDQSGYLFQVDASSFHDAIISTWGEACTLSTCYSAWKHLTGQKVG